MLARPYRSSRPKRNAPDGKCSRRSLTGSARPCDVRNRRPRKPADAQKKPAPFDAVLVNTALADAEDHAAMARAFALATEAGRLAYLAGMGPVRAEAEASSPLTGFLSS